MLMEARDIAGLRELLSGFYKLVNIFVVRSLLDALTLGSTFCTEMIKQSLSNVIASHECKWPKW